MTDHGMSFSLPGIPSKSYQLTWGTRGYWCELCALENKGDVVEIGAVSRGTYWIPEGDPTQPAAVDHMLSHIKEM